MSKSALTRVMELNAESRAWVAADPDNRWSTTLVEDPAHWQELGCHTAEDVDKYLAWCAYWDAYRDAYGVRPRHTSQDAFTLEELNAELDRLYEVIECEEEARTAAEEEDAYNTERQPPMPNLWDEIADQLES